MKKRVLSVFFIFSLIIFLSFAFAAEQSEQQKISKAYSCLEKKVNAQTCILLQQDQRAFVNLAFEKQNIPKCLNQSKSDMSIDGCWPSAGCSIKTTAQTLIALANKINTNKTIAWLESKKQIPTELTWFLEIDETSTATGMSCTITSTSASATVKFGADKKIQTVGTTGLSPCFSSAQSGYWLKINQQCYEEEFTISCDKTFLTTLLYQKTGGQTIHVSEASHTADSGSSTTEKIDSYCFGPTSNTCDYEATLWAATALQEWVGEDVHSYLPYLIALSDDFPEFLPQAFLYYLTNQADFKISLLDKQAGNDGYFLGAPGHDKFYDTALAELALSGDDQKAKAWLLKSQDTLTDNDGCWNSGNILDTAFILWAVWGDFDYHSSSNQTCSSNSDCSSPTPICVSGKCVECSTTSDCSSGEICENNLCVTDEGETCEGNGNYCITSTQCQDVQGQHIESFDLTCDSGFDICCSKPAIQKTCSELSGVVCTSNQNCAGTPDSTAAGLLSGQTCCVGGSCSDKPSGTATDCVTNLGANGNCKISVCDAGYEVTTTYTCPYGDKCCMKIVAPAKTGSLLWLWILLILIVLVVLGIVFRDTLRGLWMKYTSKKSPPSSPSSFGSPGPRRVFPPSSQNRPPMNRRPSSEVDDVLKKLKGMSR